MAELDLMTKFNRGLILSLADKNVYEAVQTYRQYTSYLHSNDTKEEFKQELIKTRVAFLSKLVDFIENKDNQDKTGDLIAAFQELITAFPDEPNFYIKCADVFKKLEQSDIVLELLNKAEENSKGKIEVEKLLYESCKEAGELEKARKLAENILKKESDEPDNYYNLSAISDKLFDKTGNEEFIKSAILNMEIARKMNPNNKLYAKSLTILYMKAGDEDKLNEAWAECLKFKNLSNNDIVDYAAHLIKHGDFKKGFELYEKRFNLEIRAVKYPEITKPRYDGKKDISKSTLLVQWEQGFGDAFLFSRFLPDLKNKAGKIIARMPDTVSAVIQRSFPFVEVVSNNVELSTLDFDYHIPMMSLPLILNLTKDNIPHTGKYLSADAEKVQKFKEKYFNNSEFKIGIVYKGSSVGMKIRDIRLEDILPVSNIKNTKIYSLQFKDPDEYYKDTNIINLGNKVKNYDDTAALIENLDLLVTTDNSVMNLAGAMGKKTFCLFGALPEFRWFDLSGEDIKWYKSVKPYKCARWGEWKPIINKVIEDIGELVK